jgi:hypothetical protein
MITPQLAMKGMHVHILSAVARVTSAWHATAHQEYDQVQSAACSAAKPGSLTAERASVALAPQKGLPHR